MSYRSPLFEINALYLLLENGTRSQLGQRIRVLKPFFHQALEALSGRKVMMFSLRKQGIHNLPWIWRRGDLLVLKKRTIVNLPRPRVPEITQVGPLPVLLVDGAQFTLNGRDEILRSPARS